MHYSKNLVYGGEWSRCFVLATLMSVSQGSSRKLWHTPNGMIHKWFNKINIFKSGRGLYHGVNNSCYHSWLGETREGRVSTAWKKIALWMKATLSETVTFIWGGGYCQSMLISQRGSWIINVLTTLLPLCPILPSSTLLGTQLTQTNKRAKCLEGKGMAFSIQVLILDQKDTVQKFGELTGKRIEKV